MSSDVVLFSIVIVVALLLAAAIAWSLAAARRRRRSTEHDLQAPPTREALRPPPTLEPPELEVVEPPAREPAPVGTRDRTEAQPMPEARQPLPVTVPPVTMPPVTAPPVTAAPPTPSVERAVEPTQPPPVPADARDQVWTKGLARTRSGFWGKVGSWFGRDASQHAQLVTEIETALLSADVGVATTEKLLAPLRSKTATAEATVAELRTQAQSLLEKAGTFSLPSQRPAVVLVVGVNGSGKTTSVGKLAHFLKQQGHSLVLAAADTYRAAAAEQLRIWGERCGCEVISGKEGADPGAVVFDAVRRGKELGVDFVLVDTAGRLHTRTPLMDELKKVARTAKKALGSDDEPYGLLVIDGTTGQNAIEQVRQFRDAVPLNGLIITKLDGTAKGGVVLAATDRFGLPVAYVGIGEGVGDLYPFDSKAFVGALFQTAA